MFDIGETLVDESRSWIACAEQVGVTPLTLLAALGALIDRGRDHREVWDLLGVAPPAEPPQIGPEDLYPDAAPTLRALVADGYRVGLAGNQPAAAEAQLCALGLPVAFVAASEAWGVAKPAAAFFRRVAESAGAPAERIAYVGDRLDNDVLPAHEAGMFAVFLVRGPWGHLHAARPEAARADARIHGLDELPQLLSRLRL